jgi:bifunctional DNase/RNase
VEKIPLEILGLSSSQSQIGSFALVLGERNGHRRLPIIIGGFEAQAIALEIENIKPNRPMTHDLILNIAQAFEVHLQEVVISDLKEGVFFANLVLEMDGIVKEIDSRPSDAIAIAVRYNAPIYTYDFILEDAGIVIKDEEGEAETTKSPSSVPSPTPEVEAASATESGSISESNRTKLIKKLTQQMEQAIGREDYELAARLRDEITRLQAQAD